MLVEFDTLLSDNHPRSFWIWTICLAICSALLLSGALLFLDRSEQRATHLEERKIGRDFFQLILGEPFFSQPVGVAFCEDELNCSEEFRIEPSPEDANKVVWGMTVIPEMGACRAAEIVVKVNGHVHAREKFLGDRMPEADPDLYAFYIKASGPCGHITPRDLSVVIKDLGQGSCEENNAKTRYWTGEFAYYGERCPKHEHSSSEQETAEFCRQTHLPAG